MNFKLMCCVVSLAALLTACPTERPLDRNNAVTVRGFAPDAIASSTQFLRGAPVTVSGATDLIQQGAASNAKVTQLLAKSPTSLNTALSRFKNQVRANALNPQAALPAAGGNDCGNISITDADNDGIPLLVNNYKFDCGGAIYDGYTATLTGTVYIKDLNDSDPSSGYDAKVSDLKFRYIDTTGSTPTIIELKMNYDVKVRNVSAGVYSVDQSFRFEVYVESDGESASLVYSYTGKLTYTPATGATNATRFSKGNVKFDNKFRFEVKAPGENYFTQLTIKSTAGLAVDVPACGKTRMVDTGVVNFSDGQNTMTWTLNSCTNLGNPSNGTWEYNGQVVAN
jgi:hypothetical protein